MASDIFRHILVAKVWRVVVPFADIQFNFALLNAPPPVQAPFSQDDWPLPRRPLFTAVSSYYNIALLTTPPPPPPTPFSQDDWPLPVRVKPSGQFWTESAQIPSNPFFQTDWPLPFQPFYPITNRTWIETPPVLPPFAQFDWPQPIRTKPLGQTWIETPQITPNPFSQNDWPNPFIPAYPITNRTWISSTALINAPVGAPFSQDDWPLPVRTKPLGQFWVAQPQITPNPFFQTDWPNPITPAYPVTNRTWISSTAAINTPSGAPFSQDDWPLPIRVKPLGQTWIETPQITPNPFSQDDWPNPLRAAQPTSARTWIGATTAILSPLAPFSQDDWPTPRGRPGLNTSFALAPQITPNPFYQSDWPNAKLVQWPVSARTWINATAALLTTPAATPFSQDQWPNPIAQPQSGQTWISTTVALLLPLKPFNQSLWPLPQVAAQPTSARTWISSTIGLLAAVRTGPFNQLDWPVPRRPKFPEGTWISSTIGLRSQVAARPFNVSDWPVPQRPGYPTLNRTITRFSQNFIPVPKIPPGYQLWELAKRRPWQPPQQANSLSALFIPPFVPPRPEPPNPERPYIRDYWDMDEWGRFIPGAGMRRG